RIENSLKMLHGAWNDDHPYIIATRDLLGKALLGLGEFAAAEDVFRRNIDLWSSSNGWDHRGGLLKQNGTCCKLLLILSQDRRVARSRRDTVSMRNACGDLEARKQSVQVEWQRLMRSLR